MDMKSLENEALGLPSQDRAKLALDLIESLEMLSPVEIEELWAQEAQRRADQIDNLPVALISAEIVSARAHALLG
jgi:putative addiction module component (TIGR02574 family)